MIWQSPVISLGDSLILLFIGLYFELLRKEAFSLPWGAREVEAISIPGGTLSAKWSWQTPC